MTKSTIDRVQVRRGFLVWLGRGVGLATALMVAFGVTMSSLLAGPVSTKGDKIKVTATTTMVADLVRKVGGNRVEVQGLMGPGVDPHLYKAAAGDITKLQRADIIFYSGLLLEGKLQGLFTKMARTKRHVYAVTESVPEKLLLEPPDLGGHYDPHVWFEVPLWERCVETVVKGLVGLEPGSRGYFEKRGETVRMEMRQLHQWALKRVAELPKKNRVLVTSHDAFNYFGRAYGFEVVGLQGISTVDDPSLAAMTQLVDFVKKKQVKAVFVESSVSPAAIKRISQDAGIKIGGELYSDAMGTPGHLEDGYDQGTYEGMVRHNVNTIVNALK